MATANHAADKATNTAKNASDQTAEQGRRTSEQAAGGTADGRRQALQLVHGMAGAAGEVQREGARRSAEGSAQLGQTLLTLLNEQAQHNFNAWKELTGAVDWDRVIKAVDWDRAAKIQTEFLRVSVERSAQLAQCYFEV